MFHDLMKLSMSRILFGADRWVDYFYTLDTADWPSIQCGYPPTGGPSCPGTFIEQADFRHEANDVNNSLIDPGIKPMRSQEFTLGMDHELNHTTSIGVRYSHKWLNRAIEAFGVLLPGVGNLLGFEPGLRMDQSPLTDPFISPGLVCPNCPDQPAAKRVYDGVEFRLREALLGQLGADHQLLVQPSLRQLLRPGELRRERQRLGENRSELQPRIRPVDGIVRRAGARRVRPAADRSPAGVQGAGLVSFRFGTTIGGNYLLQSGTPLQTQMNHLSGIFFYPFGRGDLGRTPVYSQTDLLVQHTLNLPRGTRLNASINVENLFDQDTITSIFPTVYRDNINIPFTDFFKGFDPNAYAKANNLRPDARFTLPTAYQPRRTIRLMAKILF